MCPVFVLDPRSEDGGFDGKRMLEKDGFGGRRHLQAEEDMTDERCSLPFGQKSGEYICSGSRKYICLGYLANTFVQYLTDNFFVI